MLVHKVTVKGKRGISWVERRGSEVVLIFRGGRVGNVLEKLSLHFQKVIVRSSRSDQQIIRISSNEVAIQSSAHQQVIRMDQYQH